MNQVLGNDHYLSVFDDIGQSGPMIEDRHIELCRQKSVSRQVSMHLASSYQHRRRWWEFLIYLSA